MSYSSPFFILGNPRSGTSLFRLMLNNHPEVVVPPECGFAEWLYDEFSGQEMSQKNYERFIVKVFESRKFETWGLEFSDVLGSIKRAAPKNYQDLVCEVYRGYAEKLGKGSALFGDKNNYYINSVDKLEKIFPGCDKVFIVRDGRDVACSYLELDSKKISSEYKPKLETSVRDIAFEWSRSVDVMLYWVKRGAKYIRYEDLVSDPKQQLSEVCEFLKLDYSEEMLDYYKNNDEPEEFKAWKGKTFEPVAISSVGRYKTDLSTNEIEEFVAEAEGALNRIGYHV
ncbi:MAG: sulfotransferase [Alteromonadaceae bacterium]|nr:sulfotransferase [Alteromonadaceae bacterium]